MVEGRVKFGTPQNISGPSRQNSVAAFSQASRSRRGHFLKHKKKPEKKNIAWLLTAYPMQSKSLEAQRSQIDS